MSDFNPWGTRRAACSEQTAPSTVRIRIYVKTKAVSCQLKPDSGSIAANGADEKQGMCGINRSAYTEIRAASSSYMGSSRCMNCPLLNLSAAGHSLSGPVAVDKRKEEQPAGQAMVSLSTSDDDQLD